MKLDVVLMPTPAEQIGMSYDLVIDPANATIPGRVPLFQEDDFRRPAIGWAEDIHVDTDGRLRGRIEMDDAYRFFSLTGLNWTPSKEGRPTLWCASVFRAILGEPES